MGWVPGWPTDPTSPKGALDPQAVVLHRTYGAWGGDYSVGKQGIFQFLIGKDSGRYVQFMATESVAYHCNGANFRAFGVELEGTNEEPLTDWQIAKLGEVLQYAHSVHGIPLTYQDPFTTPAASISVNHSDFRGVISHRSVATDDGSSQHTDLITPADYAKAVGTPAPRTHKEIDIVFQEKETGTYYAEGLGGFYGVEKAVGIGVGLNGGAVVPVTAAQMKKLGDDKRQQAIAFLKDAGVI